LCPKTALLEATIQAFFKETRDRKFGDHNRSRKGLPAELAEHSS